MRKTILMTTIMAVGIGFVNVAKAEIYQGDCGYGENTCSWVLDTTTGALNITGSGNQMNSTWQQYMSSIRTVTIGDGLTKIGANAFYGATNLTGVTIPSSITAISDGAFLGTSSLTAIDLPKTLTTLSDRAFYGSGITELDVPSSVTNLGDYPFYGMTNLQVLSIPDNIQWNAAYMLDGSELLSRVSDLEYAYMELSSRQRDYDNCMSDWESWSNGCDEYYMYVEMEQSNINSLQSNIEELQQALADKTLPTIQCKGDTVQCLANMTVPEVYQTALSNADKSISVVAIHQSAPQSDPNDDDDIAIGENSISKPTKPARADKRIYTIDEANRVAGPINRISITYR